jgi:hypothetical protein
MPKDITQPSKIENNGNNEEEQLMEKYCHLLEVRISFYSGDVLRPKFPKSNARWLWC